MHTQRGPPGPAGVLGPVEEEEDCVTAPLQQVGTLVVCLGQQPPEDGVEDVAQLLGTFPAAARQPLGEPGEPGDVEQHQTAVDLPVGRPGRGGGPCWHEPWYVCHRRPADFERRRH